MNQLALNKPLKIQTPTCGELIKMAEQELAAFISAVRDLFGSEQAELSTEDWLHELEITHLPSSTHEWRLLTIKASSRLARATADRSDALVCQGSGCS